MRAWDRETKGGMTIYPVIMCGGAGTRLWPVSTQDHPKQFRRLVTDKSVFQDTVLRFSTGECAGLFGPPIVISNGRYEGLIREQLDEIGVAPAAIILEPAARNTAAVAAIAARFIERLDPDALGILLPSDHFIGKPDIFCRAVQAAAATAQAGRIVTFGIHPASPETGFGYIQAGEPIGNDIRKVSAFREKPDLETAIQYLADGAYSWNAGIFLFSPETLVAELKTHAPDVLDDARAAATDADKEGREHRPDGLLIGLVVLFIDRDLNAFITHDSILSRFENRARVSRLSVLI